MTLRPRSLLPLALLVALTSCSKKDDAPGGAGAPALPGDPAAAPLAAAAAAAAFPLQGFEGVIVLAAKSRKDAKPTPPIQLQVKGTRFRFDPPAGIAEGSKMDGMSHVVVDAAKKKMFAVVDREKRVIVMDLEKLGDQMKGFSPPGSPAPTPNAAPPRIVKTGRSDTVAGRTCENWDVLSATGERAQVCVANEGASWFEMPTLGLPGDQAWARELFDGRHLPLRFIGYDKAGVEDERVEVTKLEKRPLADTIFDVPAGYAVMDVGQMMANMLGGMPPGMMPGMPGAHAGHPAAPGATSAAPAGAAGLPPGMQMPGLPPGMQLPPEAAAMMKRMQEQAAAAAAAPKPK